MKKKDIVFLAVASVVVVAIVMIFNTFIGGPMYVQGDSMNPYLEDGDIVISNKMAYWGDSKPERFDIVVFPYEDVKTRKYVKRVIGLPGETIIIENYVTYIIENGEKKKIEDYYGQLIGISYNSIADYGPVTLGEDEYFVMGDNRFHSSDSRSDDVGPIKEDEITGKILFRILPLSSFGSLEH